MPYAGKGKLQVYLDRCTQYGLSIINANVGIKIKTLPTKPLFLLDMYGQIKITNYAPAQHNNKQLLYSTQNYLKVQIIKESINVIHG